MSDAMLRVAEHFAKTDTGRQRRSNEDSLFARPPMFAVADGMGGARAGEVASRMLVDMLEAGLDDHGTDEERLAERVREANAQIYEQAQHDSDRAGMGTTVTAAVVGEDCVAVAHVGDSRAYLLRDGELEQITRDHSLVEELLRRGKLTPEEAEEHPQRSVITRALGPEPAVEVDTRSVRGRPNDVFLLCSDGLTSMISESGIADVLRSDGSLADAGRRLIDDANDAGGRDNITVVLFRLEQVGAEAEPDRPTQVGVQAPSREEVAAAVAAQQREHAHPPRTTPLPPRPAAAGAGPRRQRRIRGLRPALAVLVVLVVLGTGAWMASRAVFFVGTGDTGFVTVYRGLPYDAPGGLHLYESFYTSGVPASELAPRRRSSLLDHRLRSQRDASDLVRKLELGQVGR